MEWRDIKETNNVYQVSSCGKVRRKKGVVAFGSSWREIGGKVLSPKTKKNGYLEVNLRFKTGENGVSFYVHRLVASNWIGEIKKGYCVNHKDCNKKNNNVSNLEIVTYSQNSIHAVKNNLTRSNGLKGSKHPRATVDEDTVLIMRKLYSNGVPSKVIAKTYNLNISTARKILYNTTWTHI